MSGTTASDNVSDIYGYPVPDTWVNGQIVTADWLNRNVRDPQLFMAYAPACTVYRNSVQSLANATNVAVVFDTEQIDTDNMITIPSSNIVIQSPGLYEIQTCAFFAASAAGPLRALHIAVNGNHTYSINAAPPPSSNAVLACGGVLPLNEGDIITQICYQSSGAALNVGGDTRHRMSVRLLSTAQTDVTFTPGSGGSVSTGAKAGSSTKKTAPAPTKHVSTFASTFSRTFDGDNTTTWDDSPYCYQGYYDGNRGNTRSIVGFNSASIKSTLTGATKITGKLTFKVKHSYYNSGCTAKIGTHNYTSKPSTWAGNRVWESQLQRGSCSAGHTYTVNLSAWQCWAFQTGTATGISFGPGPSTSRTYYGFFYGATQGGKPSITFTYYK